MSKKKNSATEKEPIVLTEWQKRNLEFLKKKKIQEEEEKKLKEKLASEKKAQLLQNNLTEETPEDSSKTSSDDKKEQVTKKKEKPLKVKKEISQRQKAFVKALPVLSISLFFLLGSLFFLSPYSKMKEFAVVGNKHTTLAELSEQSRIKSSDYFLKVLFSAQKYEKAIMTSNPWVKDVSLDYAFPNHFTFNVKEYKIIAYAQVQEGFQPILENGVRVSVVNQSQLPKDYLIINLENEKAIQDLIKSLTTLPKKLVENIKSISLANSKSTADLLIIEMHDGNTVRVPQSQIEKKLPYYLKIKKHLEGTSIVDMEVGIYSTTSDIEAKQAEASKSKAEENQANSSEAQAETETTNPSIATDPSTDTQEQNPTDVSTQPTSETSTGQTEQSSASID
ncbi:cell division protein FtsQ/DivIB [Streptococcus uberis]|uniref:cell division protein FtsQ/DivIB n=1 Tax=Streptococcus uberis TaxID=1349 RepID=UPI003D6B77F2